MSLTGNPPALGVYCPECGDVRRKKRSVSNPREIKVTQGSDVVIVFPHTRGDMTPVQSKCPGGTASLSADRAP